MARKPLTRILVTVLAVGAVAGASCALLTLHSTSAVVPPVPMPVMPHPNAYDYYNKAYKLSSETDAVDYGYVKYPSPGAPVITAAEDAAAVRANLPALAMLRQGFRYPYMSPPVRSLTTVRPDRGHDRSLARVIGFEARAAEARGDSNEALIDGVDGCRMGSDLARGSSMIGALVDYACQAIGRRHAWDVVDRVDEKTAKSQALRLYQIASSEVTVSETLQQEEWETQDSLEEILRHPDWRQAFSSDITGSGTRTLKDRWNDLMLYTISPSQVIADYYGYMKGQIRFARLPYSKRNAMRVATPTDPVVAQVVPELPRFAWLHDSVVTLDELLATQLALRAYRLDHGRYPATIMALAPAYLSAVPSDIFADGKPLKYRISGNSYILYSIGPDGKDDGGTPLSDPSRPVSQRYLVADQSEKGDIVAGVNY